MIEGFDGSYVEEMQGIARGAGTDLEQIVLLNARTDSAAAPMSSVAICAP